jgi:hypothetical protein
VPGFPGGCVGKGRYMGDRNGHARRPRGASAAVLALVAVAALLAGCGDDDGDGAARTTTSTTGDAGWEECRHGEGIYSVEHPADWRTNSGDVLPTCTLFDPEPISVERGTEIPLDVAVSITVERVPAERIVEGDDGEVLDEREATVAGRSATRIEAEASGDLLHPEGTLTTRWVVPIDGSRSILARTHDIGDVDYERKQDVLDAMVRSLTLHDAASTSTSAPPDEGAQPVGRAGTDEVASPGFPASAQEVAYLTDVRVAGHPGFDRVVLELDSDTVPSYRVAYTDPPVRQAGSGNRVEIDGEAFVTIDLVPASGVDLRGSSPDPTYTGPDRIELTGGAAVQEVVQTGDFEAHLSWAVGLDERVPFAVTTLDDPARLVVDFVPSG